MSRKGHIIKSVKQGSIAEELEIEAGDELISIDGNEIKDVLDYRFYVNSEAVTMLIKKADGELWELDIEHFYEDLGIEFEDGLMSDYRSCANNCVFCFIDQMPKGMRDTLYFKDDDTRLSFLQGNYVTLTNMSDKEIDRIIRMGLAPINISVHTTNPELRVAMLKNKRAGKALKYIDKLYKENVPMNSQIVLCKGYNDGNELRRTLLDLLDYAPVMQSCSVVPIGLTKFRDGLDEVELIDKDTALETIDIINTIRKLAKKRHNINFAYASDEMYLTAGLPLPESDEYDGYMQLENGVGMLRLLHDETVYALENTDIKDDDKKELIYIATGKLAAPMIEFLSNELMKKFPSKKIKVFYIKNNFFGETITVTGLLTATDIIEQLKDQEACDRLILSENMFRTGEEVFLDDYTKEDVEKALNTKVVIVGGTGEDFIEAAVLGRGREKNMFKGYEIKSKGDFNE